MLKKIYMAFPEAVCASDEGTMGSVRIIIAHQIDQMGKLWASEICQQ
jgi:hypothetical protein